MGFHLALARFEAGQRGRHLLWVWGLPFVLHGVFDFILMYRRPLLLLALLPFLVLLWVYGLKRIKRIVEDSSFNPETLNQ